MREQNRASQSDIHGPPAIVIVDGDAGVLGALTFAMEMEGFVVYAFRSGAEALAERNLPSAGCLITDHRLPDMSGMNLLAALRDRGVKLPAILLTSHSSAHRVRRQSVGFDIKIVEKPLFGSTLLDAVRSVPPTP